MDEKRLSGATGSRLSAIPRPTSRLPVPRSSISNVSAVTSTPQTQQPTEPTRGRPTQSVNTSEVRNPRLRATASREHIGAPGAPSTVRRTQRSAAPPISSQANRRDLGTGSRSVSRGSGHVAGKDSRDIRDDSFKKPLVPRRRPSTQFTIASPTPSNQGALSPEEDDDVAVESLPPLMRSSDDDVTFDTLMSKPRKPRPSLTERTMETLSQLPSSPAFKRRGSDFFGTEAPRRPQSKGSMGSRSRAGSRPGSSYQSDGSTIRPARSLSRPGSSSGQVDNHYPNFRASTNTYKPPLSTVVGTPTKRPSATGSRTPRPGLSKAPSRSSLSGSVGPSTPSPTKHLDASVSRLGSKTVSTRPLKPRASMNNLYRQPSLPSLDRSISDVPPGPYRKASLVSAKSSSTSGDGRNLSSASTASTALTVDSIEEAPASAVRKSSAALRDQIAKAKAAKRAASRQASVAMRPEAEEAPVVPTDTTFDFGLSDDPFGQRRFENANRQVMQSRIDTARTTGRLNIAAMGLRQIPVEVLKMYDLESVDGPGSAWAESVDLTRFVAADNELETIDDAIFPDSDPNDFSSEEECEGRIFGGLESLDLHGNMLIALPMGLRRLQLLTSLNLASNKLTNNCLEVISQLSTVRDLKLGNNLLYGRMEENYFSNLQNLEILDLHGNNISSLPDGIDKLGRLRMLNLNENAFETLPFGSLSMLPLTELLARKNKLSGTLIGPGVEGFPQLQILDVAANQLQLIVDGAQPLELPSLHQFTISLNRIVSLPDVSSWASLLTINADENSITAFPEGFTSLRNLRHVDFTSNDIRVIPPEVSRMDSIAMLRITGNPLRDRKFTSLTTEELKDVLAARMEPANQPETGGMVHFGNGSSAAPPVNNSSASLVAPASGDDDDEGRLTDVDDFATPPTSAPPSPARSRSHTLTSQSWPMKPGGLLDRSDTQSSSLHPVICSKISAAHTVREVRLQQNTFTQFPNSLSFFTDTITSLSMAQNQLTGESWLTEPIDLTALRELSLASNFITSLTPLTTNLCAPNLVKADFSFNRIVKLPVLREFFPSLTILLVSNNRLEELDPESIKGMKVVDASNNEIAHLNPRIGLLGGTGSLEKLEVTGNRFRVPRWNVLERGTDATLRWLRGRVPVAEMAEWKARSGEAEEDSSNEVD
ncbi:uncharacterized protein GGS22DRAFT_176201 [Annulohypoxylon maeteangense]|uniref:uncharacterized protein n=1 Tax=Annulohypoxylon maeteangense TaxID=1927788 RepID=UPI0020086A83|nr:uncharacterized protein GGS22DRAFT_176201 [Annulohypoxylon maeteangense]KAI0880009.1 hypothetical protein GGS22DRAFT_176201 [Annulohypoxylon maeteangense]